MSSVFFVILGPSGAGKGTLFELLEKSHKHVFQRILSVTTRAPREGEKEGEQYHFFSIDQFTSAKEKGEFLEYACVHQSAFYGTLKAPVFACLDAGQHAMKEVDYQGLIQLKQNMDVSRLCSIFIMPPEESILRERIKERAPISERELDHRMVSVKKELEYAKECDHIFWPTDGDIAKSYKDFESLIFSIEKESASQ